MKKILKTTVALGLAVSLVFFSSPFKAFAGRKDIVIDGREMWIETSVSATSATASTYAGLEQAWTTVVATYVYIDRDPLSPTFNKTSTKSSLNFGYVGSSITFSAPKGCTSVKVSASHTISYDTIDFSDSTVDEYYY